MLDVQDFGVTPRFIEDGYRHHVLDEVERRAQWVARGPRRNDGEVRDDEVRGGIAFQLAILSRAMEGYEERVGARGDIFPVCRRGIRWWGVDRRGRLWSGVERWVWDTGFALFLGLLGGLWGGAIGIFVGLCLGLATLGRTARWKIFERQLSGANDELAWHIRQRVRGVLRGLGLDEFVSISRS